VLGVPGKIPRNNFHHLFARDLNLNRLAFAFTPLSEPRAQPFREALRGQSKTRFDFPFGNRKRVVKLSGVREIAHAELIEPFERACAALPTNYNVDDELLRIHENLDAAQERSRRKDF